jgi:uncharacterized membrane protein (DUF4010 family)
MMLPQAVLNFSVAALAGLAVGIEREWSGHAEGPNARFAGVRTFMLLGILGGAAGWMSAAALVPLAVTLLAGGAALSVAAYALAARRGPGSADGTTEAAALVVLALGTLAGLGELALASGTTAVIVLALMEKERVHHLVQRIGARELRSTLQFAVMSLVILPLLPTDSYGPLGGVQPRSLWILVLLFTGLNFAGYLARRALGPERGYGAAGMIGGIISSTAVTLSFSRRSRAEPALSAPLAFGIVGACTVLLLRLVAVTAVLDSDVSAALVPYLVPPLVVGAIYVGFAMTRRRDQAAVTPADKEDDDTQNPLRLGFAIKMAIAFQVALWAVAFVRAIWGNSELLASAALLGLTDMDALTITMTRLGASGEAQLAALAIAVGVVSNTVLKLGVTLTFGSPALRRFAGIGLALLGAASVVGIWALNR